MLIALELSEKKKKNSELRSQRAKREVFATPDAKGVCKTVTLEIAGPEGKDCRAAAVRFGQLCLGSCAWAAVAGQLWLGRWLGSGPGS